MNTIRAVVSHVELYDDETLVEFLFAKPQPIGNGWTIFDINQPDPARRCVGTELVFDDAAHDLWADRIGKVVDLRRRRDGYVAWAPVTRTKEPLTILPHLAG